MNGNFEGNRKENEGLENGEDESENRGMHHKGMYGRGMHHMMMGGMHEHNCMHMHNGMRHNMMGLKYLILKMSSEKEISGSDVIRTVSKVTRGMKRPSPGNVYPALKGLTEDGYLSKREDGSMNYYSITDKGKELIGDFSRPIFSFANPSDEESDKYLDAYALSSELDKMQSDITYLNENLELIKDEKGIVDKIQNIIDEFEKLKSNLDN